MRGVAPTPLPSRPAAAGLVYGAAFLQGLAVVSFPGLSAVLTGDLGISDAAYGALFLPQIALAVLGALAGGLLARRFGLKRLLVGAMLANVASQLCLAGSALAGPAAVLPVLMLGGAALGLAFGLLGAPLNTYPRLLFPARADAALVTAHTLFGAGFAVGPFVAGLASGAGLWPAYPLTVVALALCTVFSAGLIRLPVEAPPDPETDAPASAPPLRNPAFWTLVAIVILYAVAEGTFSNWAVVFLSQEKQVDSAIAPWGLSAFWAALVTGRLVVATLLVRFRATPIWLALPVLMMVAFNVVPATQGTAAGIAAFAFAGLACSAFFPLTVAEATRRFPGAVPFVSAMMMAALMIGAGSGTFLVGLLREAIALGDLFRLSALYPAVVLVLALGLIWRAGRRRDGDARH